MEHDKKSGKYEDNSAKGFWERFGNGLFEGFVELILWLVAFAIGGGILFLFGQAHLLIRMNPELIVLIGVLAVLAVAGIVIAVVAVVKKKKK